MRLRSTRTLLVLATVPLLAFAAFLATRGRPAVATAPPTVPHEVPPTVPHEGVERA